MAKCNRKNGTVTIEQRRQRVAELYVKGLSQHQIAEQVGVTQKTICKDLQVVREQWQESALLNFNERTALELARLDRLESEAWAAFERSKRDLETETDRVETTTGGDRVITSVTKKQVNADVRYLEVIARCVELRSKITGILKPANLSMNTTVIQWDDLATHVIDDRRDTVDDRIQRLLSQSRQAPAVIEHQDCPLLLEIKTCDAS